MEERSAERRNPSVVQRVLCAAGTLVRAPLLLVLLALTACGEPDADAERVARLEQGAEVVRSELEGLVARGMRALDRVVAELDQVSAGGEAVFRLLAKVRKDARVDGILIEDRRGRHEWAGRILEPQRLPAPSPWDRSFATGSVYYLEGPFVCALLLQQALPEGRRVRVSILLDDPLPGEDVTRRFAGRWLDPLGLARVYIRPPGLPPADFDPLRERWVEVTSPNGKKVLGVRILGPHPEAVREQLLAQNRTRTGWFWLGVLALVGGVGVWFLLRRVTHPVWKHAGLAFFILLLRQGLKSMDLPGRFVELRELFSPSRFFSVETPLGWFGSPGDFALTGVTALFFSICIVALLNALVPRESGRARQVRLAVTPLLVGGFTAVWLILVSRSVGGGHVVFFETSSFLPDTLATVTLMGLVTVTTATYVLASYFLRRALPLWPNAWRIPARLGLGIAVAFTAWALAHISGSGAWAFLGIPLVIVPLLGKSDPARAFALPSRVLLLSILATALVFPVLWYGVEQREQELLRPTLRELIQEEMAAELEVRSTLQRFTTDAYLAQQLETLVEDGLMPERLAFHLWMSTEARVKGDPVQVTVLTLEGVLADEFTLAALPPRALPLPQPQLESDPDEITLVKRGDASRVRCIVGHLRVRGSNGQPVGYVVVTRPDLLDLRLKGLTNLLAPELLPAEHPLTVSRRFTFTKLQGEAVEESSDPYLSRGEGGFGPATLGDIPEDLDALAWKDEHHQGVALWDEDRGATYAVRRDLPTGPETLLALARLVVAGVGLGGLVALVLFLVLLPQIRWRLQHRILLAFFLVSVIPIAVLAFVTARDATERHEQSLRARLNTDLSRARSFMEGFGDELWFTAVKPKAGIQSWAADENLDLMLFRQGRLVKSNRVGLVDGELISRYLPAEVYRATEYERRQVIRKDAIYAGRDAWFGYAPILDTFGKPLGTVAVPLFSEQSEVARQVTSKTSILLAGYLLALVTVFVIGIVAARRIARPVDVLARGTHRVAEGDLEVELPGAGDDEFGQLVASFNAMTRELRLQTERAAAAEREVAWRQMARQIAHEIRNPLTPMRLLIQQMEAEARRDPERAEETIRKASQVVLRQIDALDRIAGDFSDFARLPRRAPTAVDVHALVDHVVTLHGRGSPTEIEVRGQVAEDTPAAWGDEQELQRVLLNLVANAVQAISGPGRVEVRAQAAADEGRAGIGIEVRDTGEGIEPENRSRLFDPHFSTKTSGTGLGLAIVARIIQDMGGWIRVDSEPGVGTTFRCWWPAEQGAA